MPPKKQAKKGHNYKAGTLVKDIVPSSVKQPPRQGRAVKLPEIIPQFNKKSVTNTNQDYQSYAFPEVWPGNQIAKDHNFNIESNDKFTDGVNWDQLQIFRSQGLVSWKHGVQINNIKRQIYKKYEAQKPKEIFQTCEYFEKDNQKVKCLSQIIHSPLLQPHQTPYKQMTVLEFFMREETEEQIEKRKKEEQERLEKLAKEKKKQPKKQQKDQGPFQVKDVKLSNVKVKGNEQLRWIGSQIQLIKQLDIRDINSGQPLWKRIYPQQDSFPVFNKSDRYWVKLNYMGKQVKIQVDGRMPIDVDGEILMPCSQKSNQIWVQILTKAVIKLLMSNESGFEVLGNGLVMQALTGVISQNIQLNEHTKWQQILQNLQDINYLQKNVYVSVYSSKNKDIYCPTNKINQYGQLQRYFLKGNRQLSLEYINNVKKNQERKEKEKQIEKQKEKEKQRDKDNQKDVDLEEPDLVEEQPQDKRDWDRKRSYSCPKIKNQQFKEDKKPQNILKGYAYPVIEGFHNANFNMVYVMKKSAKQLRLRQQYNQLSKMSMANKTIQEKKEHRRRKKQVKDKLNMQDSKRIQLITKPPNPFRLLRLLSPLPTLNCQFCSSEIRLAQKCILNKLNKPPNYQASDNRDDKSTKSMSINMGIGHRKNQQQIINHPLDDFSMMVNVQQPIKRQNGGLWVMDKDILGCFDNLMYYYNPSKYVERYNFLVEPSNHFQFTQDLNREVILINKSEEFEELKILVSFGPQKCKNVEVIPTPYLIVQQYDFIKGVAIKNYRTLKGTLDSLTIKLQNKTQTLRILSLTPLPYTFYFCSTSNTSFMSFGKYLQSQQYKSIKQTIDYPSIEQDKFYVYYRLRCTSQKQTQIIMNIKQLQFLSKLRIRMIQGQNKMVDLEGVVKNSAQKVFLGLPYTRISIKQNIPYIIILQGRLPFATAQGSFQIQTFFQKQSQPKIQLLEQVQPLKYVQKYIPNKYQTIFRERLFVSTQTVGSIFMQIFDVTGNSKEQAVDKKGGKKAQIVQGVQHQLQSLYYLSLTLFKEQQAILYQYGYNHAILYNVFLHPNQHYFLQARFVLDVPQDTQRLNWSLRVFASDTIVVVRDTIKIDFQKSIRNGWQQKEPGRAQRAKRARKKYFALQKLRNGQILPPQQKELLERKKKKPQELQDKKGKGKKDAKGKGGKKQDIQQEKKDQIIERPPPKSQENIAIQLQSFLKHMQSKRIINDSLSQNESAIVRSQQNMKQF